MSLEDLEKHLNIGDRRQRFDPQSRYGGRGGASVVKARPKRSVSVDGYNNIHLAIERPRNDQGSVLISKADQDVPELCRGAELPLGLALQLPELLEQLCVRKSTKRSIGALDVVITTYVLEGVDWMAPSQEERRLLEQRRDARLVLLTENRSSGRAHPLCSLPGAPLEKISDPSVLDIHSRLSARGNDFRCAPHLARVFAEDVASCFFPSEDVVDQIARSDTCLLEVDLGANCQVTFISTQGRFPPIQGTDKETGSRIVQEGHPAYNNWVLSYELSCRAASGRHWVSLGEFKGNSDMNTEVAHEMAVLTCRYLRFRPLQYNGQPAMRVGVYGKRLDMEGLRRRPESEEMVQYSIHRIKENVNTRRVPIGGSGQCRYGCAACSKNRGICALDPVGGPKSRRLRLRAGVVQEVRGLASDVATHGQFAIDEDEEEAACAGTEVVADGASPGALSAPRFARQWSHSDLNFSSAESSSSGTLGESIEVVVGTDENEWLVFDEAAP
mmetsp:Transcript_66720/g.169090  ORF Transcript_66720/g.169090 Transcript_66720/m.169090 type:complete len:500 (-) Transcript_66720:266-1765(-)|eukprot:CAMPEP_0183401402 /NCGR_PEP_ID=MMETSP0370-20130417/13236_1 /TAXON_ID=268820 /ORGANISM="Peridinium aciculiferum, Strain PAER-2" /LENGTH=499 /DNA_ID=CAMNT_0025582859 /DNA_START=58 /DNA_END=1557 /DNA_ORIENTATION=-